MSAVILGQRMVRIADGQQGVVSQNGPELRITYMDRGSERVALKSEKWVPDELKPGPMLPPEMLSIAKHADRALRAHERNEPLHWWEPPGAEPLYDLGLVNVIIGYLRTRETRPAT